MDCKVLGLVAFHPFGKMQYTMLVPIGVTMLFSDLNFEIGEIVSCQFFGDVIYY